MKMKRSRCQIVTTTSNLEEGSTISATAAAAAAAAALPVVVNSITNNRSRYGWQRLTVTTLGVFWMVMMTLVLARRVQGFQPNVNRLVTAVVRNHPNVGVSPRTTCQNFQQQKNSDQDEMDNHVGKTRIRDAVEVDSSNNSSNNIPSERQNVPQPAIVSRRSSLQTMFLTATATATAVATFRTDSASAGIPEVDTYGNLFSPKSDMLSGGSQAARGISSRQRGSRLKPGQPIQTVYETRFIAYLSRFLLNFDPAANAWWLQQNGFRDTWDTVLQDDSSSNNNNDNKSEDPNLPFYKFAEFAESVEVGLADYFTGPYGSYSSVQAAKAGILASNTALSRPQPKESGPGFPSFITNTFSSQLKNSQSSSSSSSSPRKSTKQKKDDKRESISPEKNGVLNLYSLLKARYTSVAAKRQLAILFSFISRPDLQPMQEIIALLGEADNATISDISLLRQVVRNEETSRTSSRRGGGFSKINPPVIVVDAPPALGDEYQPAEVRPIMRPTSRVLRIQVLDPGEGYTNPPPVFVYQNGAKRSCQACTIVDGKGYVSEVLVLDPGYGYGNYGGKDDCPPTVKIEPPKKQNGKVTRQALAVADLEYEVVDVELIKGGNGYIKAEPPNVVIPLPDEDPDWFIATQEQPEMRTIPVRDIEPLRAEVSEMKNSDGNVVYDFFGFRPAPTINRALIQRLRRDPLELLPSTVMLEIEDIEEARYQVASLPPIPPNIKVPSPRFRAFDPIFGGVGSVPVTKGAAALSASEYGRLALSGAVCTVIVRTALNPLELIKTKQQLDNDKELFEYARNRGKRKAITTEKDIKEPVGEDRSEKGKIGILDIVLSLAELRGPLALFQSADITFLASLVFGSFGFGTTELFRRSFTEILVGGDSGASSDGGGGGELILLLAAAIGTVVTSAAATPFEVLRVKSMILLEPAEWTRVLQTFIKENPASKKPIKRKTKAVDEEFKLSNLDIKDLLPLWSGFAPTLSRELSFAIPKFVVFDVLSRTIVDFVNSQTLEGALPLQVGAGPAGLAVSAVAGAIAGVAGAVVSHPADLILTYTSVSKKSNEVSDSDTRESAAPPGWVGVVKELLSREGGVANLFIGLPARGIFFFLVIGLQFFLYDYVKNLFQVGTDDLSLVLDVFYAVREGLVNMDS